MGKTIKINDLSKAISEALTEYSEEVEKEMLKEIDVTAQKVKESLTNNKNIPTSNAKTRHYAKSFYIKKIQANQVVIANKKYQLTHLLEKGHATRNGGRTRAFPHWKQAEAVAQELYDNLVRRLKK